MGQCIDHLNRRDLLRIHSQVRIQGPYIRDLQTIRRSDSNLRLKTCILEPVQTGRYAEKVVR